MSAPTSIPRVEVVLARLVVTSLSNCKFPIVSDFCLIVDSRFHPSRGLTRSLEAFTPSTWMDFCLGACEMNGHFLKTRLVDHYQRYTWSKDTKDSTIKQGLNAQSTQEANLRL